MPDVPLLSKVPHKKLLLTGIGTFIIFLLLFLIYNRLFLTVPHNSDDANFILEAVSFLQGNLIFKGWYLPTDNLLTSYIPIAALLMAIRGFTPSLIDNTAAMIYALVVMVSLILVKNTATLRDKWPNMIISLLIIGMPSVMLTGLVATFCLRTYIYFLVALLAMERIRSSRLKCLTVFIMLTLAYIGDPFTLYILLAPLIILLCIRWYYEGRRLDGLSLIASTIAVIPATKFVLLAVKALGGYYPFSGYYVSFVTFEGLSNNIGLTIHGVLSLFGIDFFGQPLMSRVAIESLVRIPFLLLVCYLVYRTIQGFINHSTKYDAISEILSLSIVVDLLAYIFSNNTQSLGTTRYLIPVILFGAIIVGRQLVIPDTHRVKYLFLIGLFVVAYTLFFITRITAIAPSPYAELEAWLTSNHYQYGYGAYWDASVVTVETDNNVKIRQVLTIDNGKYIAPFDWSSQRSWYKSYPANFFVYDDSNWDGVNMVSAVNTFGQPTKVDKIGSFTVLTWDKNITPELFPAW